LGEQKEGKRHTLPSSQPHLEERGQLQQIAKDTLKEATQRKDRCEAKGGGVKEDATKAKAVHFTGEAGRAKSTLIKMTDM